MGYVLTPRASVASAVVAEIARRRHRQADAAAVLGVSRQSLSLRLNGLQDFRVAELYALAEWLDVPISVLMDEPSASAPTEGTSRRRAPAHAIPA